MFYDPMIAKLVTWGPDRTAAIDAQIAALDAFELDGIGQNLDFLSALMQHPRFREGRLTTGFIAEEYPEGFQGAPADPALLDDLAIVAALAAHETDLQACGVTGQLNAVPPAGIRVVRIGGSERRIGLERYEGGHLATLDDGEPHDVLGHWRPGQLRFRGTVDGHKRIVRIARKGRRWQLTARGASHLIEVLPEHVALLSRHMIEKVPPDLSKFLIAPMPGLLTRLDVNVGDAVEAGQPLAVVEAMKMENILRAEKAGTVKSVNARPGESLAVDAVILEFD